MGPCCQQGATRTASALSAPGGRTLSTRNQNAHRLRRPFPTQTKGEPPASIRTAVTIIYVLLAVAFLGFILQIVLLDDIVDRALESQGSGADEDAVRTAAIVGGVFGLLLFGGLYVVLAMSLRKGANWARIVLTVLGALGLTFGLFALFGDEPVLVMLFRIVTLALTAALLYFMWQPDASAYLTGRSTA